MSILSLCSGRPLWGLIVAALALPVCTAGAQTAAAPGGTPAPSVYTDTVGAVSGTTQRIAYFTALNGDCSSMGYPAVHVWRRPAFGELRIVHGTLYPHSASGSGLAQCDAHLAPATIVQYRTPADFTGVDAVAFTVTWPSGGLRGLSVRLIVAPDDYRAPGPPAPQTAPDAPATEAPAGLRHVAF